MFRFHLLFDYPPIVLLIGALAIVMLVAIILLGEIDRWRARRAERGPRHRRWPLLAMGFMGVAMSLAGCASLGGVAATAAFQATQKFTIAEDSFDGLIDTADTAIDTGALPQSVVARIHSLGDAGYGYIKVGRTAVVAADAATIAAQAAALQSLAPQIAALIPGYTAPATATPTPAPAAPPPAAAAPQASAARIDGDLARFDADAGRLARQSLATGD